jgi:cold-inducible RNA-binding protein
MPKPMRPLQAPRGWLRHAGIYWLPPLLWMAVMFVLSTDTFAAEHTGGVLWHVLSGLAPRVTYEQYTLLHFLIRKAAHLTEYAILACLLLRACRAGAAQAWHWRWATLSFVLVAIHAGLDEYHQAFTQSRTGSVSDSVLDMTGGLIALALLWCKRRKPAGRDRHRSVCRGPLRESSMNIFVGNLAWSTTEEDLAQLFHPYGEIASVRILTDRDTGRSRGFGFVEMPNATEANAAIVGLQGATLEGRMLSVSEARPREERGGPRRPRDERRPRW